MSIKQQRNQRIVQKAINKFDLQLDDLMIFTEAANGNYLYTSIASALAGAKHVFAVTNDSNYGTKEDVKRQTMDEAKELGVNDKITVLFKKDLECLSKCDIITNTGFVRPINDEMISSMKPTAVIPLMYEPWEFRKEDIDIEACNRKGILVLGTNEECPPLDIMRYSGFLVSKLLFECGLGVHMDRILILGSGRIGRNIASYMQNNRINYQWHQLDRADNEELPASIDLSSYDAIVVAEHYHDVEIIGKNGILKSEDLSHANPIIQIIHICGNIDFQDIREHGLDIFPPSVKPFGHMTVTADYIGPKATIELNIAGLKVGEIMARNRLKSNLISAHKKSLDHPLVADMKFTIR